MFLTLYLDVRELNVVRTVAFNHFWTLPLTENKPAFLKAVSDGQFTVTRVMVARANDNLATEYHCVELTGKSYVVVDNASAHYTLDQLDVVIDTLASKHPLDTPAMISPWVIEFATLPELNSRLSAKETVTYAKTFPMTPQRGLNEHEQYFHEFARALAAEYFNGA